MYRMNKNILMLIPIICISGIVSCEDGIGPSPSPCEYDDCDLNALLMDLYLTDEVFPSFDYYYELEKNVRKIESEYGDEYPRILDISFQFPFFHNELRVVADDTTKLRIDSGDYPAWDSLNTYFNLDTLFDYEENYVGQYYVLRFNCCSHMKFLVDDYYINLPGIINAAPNGMPPWYPYTNLFPRAFGDTLSLLYSYCGSRDTFGSCGFQEFYYFRFVNRKLDFVGHWYSKSGEPLPDWWYDEAHLNDLEYYELFMHYRR